MRFPSLVLAVLLLSLAVAAGAEEVSNVQLNSAHTGGSITGSMAPSMTKAWTVDLGAVVYGTAIANGQVFAATAGKNNGSGTSLSTLYALATGDGSITWGPVMLAGVLGGASTPVYENGRVFILSSTGILQAFDAQTGLPLWSQTLAGDSYGGYYEAPTIRNGVVYVAGGSRIFAVDAVSGVVRWNIVASGYSSLPTVADDGLYVGYNGPKVYKFDLATGALIWSYLPGYTYNSSGVRTAVYRGRVYVADSSATASLILDAATGKQVGTAPDDFLPALAVSDAYFRVGSRLQKRDLLGAGLAWTFNGDGALTGLPLYLNGYLYMASTKGNVFGIEAASGQQLWTADLSALLPTTYYFDYSHPFNGLSAAEGCLTVPIANTLTGFSYTVARVPLIDPPAAGSITGRAAMVAASIDSNGSSTTAHVEYGTDANYGLLTPDFVLDQSSGPIVAYSEALSGLAPGTLYHYRIVAVNASGTASTPDQTLTTGSELAPSAKTALPTASTQATATINGSVNPNGLPTQAYFEYGPTTAYGMRTPSVDVGAFNQWMPVTAALTGLSPNVSYHYRVTATNSAGTTSSGDQGFLTPPPVAPTVTGQGASESNAGVVLTVFVNPNSAATTGYFEYWDSYYYGPHLFTSSVLLGSGTSPAPLSATLPASVPAGSYSYRAIAVNSLGTTYGSTTSLQIQGKAYVPTVTTGGASAVSNRSATVAGTVVSAQNVTIQIEYGPTDTYGQTVTVTRDYYGNSVSAQLYELIPDTTYHYRVVAATTTQTAYGADKTFRTSLYSSTVGATDDVAFVSLGKPVEIAVLANDLAEPGETLTILDVTQGSYGKVAFDAATGLVTYTPDKGFAGPDSFSYTVVNPNGNAATGSVQVSKLELVLAGNYSGLLGVDGDKFAGRGQVTITATAAGAVSGRIRLGAGVWALGGKMLNGKFKGVAKGAGQPALKVNFEVDPELQVMGGAITQCTGDILGFNATRSAYTRDAPNPHAGRFTLSLAPVSGTTCAGNGYATMTVAANGAVVLVGKTGNGRPLSASSFLDSTDQFPLYCCLNAKAKESLTGVMTFEYLYNPTSDLDGTLSWISADAALLADNHTSLGMNAYGSYYLPPVKGTRVLDYDDTTSNVLLAVAPDGADYQLQYSMTLTARNTFVPEPNSGVTLSLNVTTGLFVGRMVDPDTHRVSTIGGVIFLDQQRAYGLFASPTKVLGSVYLAPN